MVELQPSKLNVAGSSPVSRSKLSYELSVVALVLLANNHNNKNRGRCSSVVEHFLGKEEVGSSILLNGSINFEELVFIEKTT